MAIVAERTQTMLVTTAVAAVHQARCGQVVVTNLGSMLPELGLMDSVDVIVCSDAVEVVADGALEELLPAIAVLAVDAGVVVLVAAGRMGEAHRALRGTECVLQPWWRTDGVISFGAIELP